MGHGLSPDLLQSQFLWSNSSTYTLLTKNTKSIAPEKKNDIHTAHGRLFHLHPTPKDSPIQGGLWWPHSPEDPKIDPIFP